MSQCDRTEVGCGVLSLVLFFLAHVLCSALGPFDTIWVKLNWDIIGNLKAIENKMHTDP